MKARLADQRNRERFASELDRNFSVVAAAGSGKTTAITDRIVHVAQDRHAREWLPQLVVVAFTNRAADEMQQRARSEILRAGVSLDVLPAFNRAFFGTIHSFCVRLLESYGHHLGLPPRFDVITDDEELWNDFVQQQIVIGRALSEENRRELLRHVQARQLMELGRRADLPLVPPPDDRCPDTDFTRVYRFPPKGSSMQTIPALQEELERAEEVWRNSADFVRWPVCTSGAKEFVPIWREAFAPLRDWRDRCALCVAAEVQRDYREFRLERGMLTYNDQVALALELMRHSEAAHQIRENNFRVILDEAQDTDPRQFALLLEVSRPAGATGDWLETRRDGPAPGHFCMVGDFQQSIYRDRADLSHYRQIHHTLVETGTAEALEFSVTFRLDTKQLEFVNETFREILNNEADQVEFVKLSPRPGILPGQVVRVDLGGGDLKPDARGKISEARKATEEAQQLARWLRDAGLSKLRANSWRAVAILCPRKEWLQTLRRALREIQFEVQIQSERELKGDSPAYAWFTALMTIMADPQCSYEIVGVLREVFGISDHDLALFSEGFGDRFQIETLTNGSGVVAKKLTLLAQTRWSILNRPLFEATTVLVEQTKLTERLRALPAEDFEDLKSELDALLAAAAAAESEQKTLSEFAESLRRHFYDPREVRPSTHDAIQLITSQKAKGSEWQAVIVPFFARKVGLPSPRYPRLIHDGRSETPILLLDRGEVTRDIEDMLDLEQRQEMERLLYVALTRARHTLVLAADPELFAKKNGGIHSSSQMKWFRADETGRNRAVLENISTEAVACGKTAAHQKKAAQAKSAKIDSQSLPESVDAKAAARNASAFVQTLNPSRLAPERIVETDNWLENLKAPGTSSPALRYGVWWHDLIQQIGWQSDGESWKELFERGKPSSPDAARSKREWEAFEKAFENGSPFRRRIAASVVHKEMPILWRIDQARCLEGVVDLALFESDAKKISILDWKTNRITPDKIDNLRLKYLPQMAAYWRAVGELTGAQVEAAIYSTSVGQLIQYDEPDLAKEWERLRILPPTEFRGAIEHSDSIA
jgi:ATP-dependent exoDNAse (exonuclease V) beta subunit